GHIACTQGGEGLAGVVEALKRGVVRGSETAVIDSTAHALKFSGFQEMYFEGRFPAEFEVVPDPALQNRPQRVHPADLEKVPAPGQPLEGEDFALFVERTARDIAERLGLTRCT
ncbi:threonine synthase, partial [Thermodesulfobacteriota bacterium]